MSESPESVVGELETWCDRLRVLADGEPDTAVEPGEQLAIEHAIATGVAVLAGETVPVTAPEPSGRSILARDLLITADLVLRALHQHTRQS